MSRINTNTSSMIAQRNLTSNNKTLNTTLERLSTGLRINRGKDDPAGLIASENLRAEKVALGSAISNAERADQIANIAEGGLQEVSNLLTDLKGLVTATANGAGLSAEEKQANQLQIDSILQTIDRISDSTNFQGVKLLNGNMDFTTSSVSGNVSDFRVNAAKINANSTMGVTTNVTTSAQRGAAFVDFNTSAIVTTSAGKLFTVEIAGANGSREFSFSNGTTMAQAVTAINSFKDVLGISAAAVSSGLDLRSTDFGSDQFVSIKVIEDVGVAGANIRQGLATDADNFTGTATAVADNALVRDTGQDIGGTINGILATGKGRTLRVASDFLDTEVTLKRRGRPAPQATPTPSPSPAAERPSSSARRSISAARPRWASRVSPLARSAVQRSPAARASSARATWPTSPAVSRSTSPPVTSPRARRSLRKPSARSRASAAVWVPSRRTRSAPRSTASTSRWRTPARPRA